MKIMHVMLHKYKQDILKLIIQNIFLTNLFNSKYTALMHIRGKKTICTLRYKQAHRKPPYLTDCTMVSSKSDSGKQKESNPEN
jgi:hypothetical protein